MLIDVYHGSPQKKLFSNPTRHIRTRNTSIEKKVLFDALSFHVSPEYWIALCYTYSRCYFNYYGKQVYYNVEVDLYNNKKEIIIHGIESLEKSILALYGNGGYVATFSRRNFQHTKGLGDLELFTSDVVKAKYKGH